MNEEGTKSAFQAIAERMWNDVAGLPWLDPSYSENEEVQRLAKEHFVQATTIDLVDIHNNLNKETV